VHCGSGSSSSGSSNRKHRNVKKKVLGAGSSVGGGAKAAVSGLKGMSGEATILGRAAAVSCFDSSQQCHLAATYSFWRMSERSSPSRPRRQETQAPTPALSL
jgi:hypothetical protein